MLRSPEPSVSWGQRAVDRALYPRRPGSTTSTHAADRLAPRSPPKGTGHPRCVSVAPEPAPPSGPGCPAAGLWSSHPSVPRAQAVAGILSRQESLPGRGRRLPGRLSTYQRPAPQLLLLNGLWLQALKPAPRAGKIAELCDSSEDIHGDSGKEDCSKSQQSIC